MRKAVIRYPAHIHVRGAGQGKASWHRWVCGDGVRAWTCEMRTRPESQSAYAVSTTRAVCSRTYRAQGTGASGPSTGTPLNHSFVVFGGYILITFNCLHS